MSARSWSDADRELVADAIYAPLPGDPTPRPEFNRTGARLHNKAGRVLDALTAAGKLADPDHDARVRADERARVAELLRKVAAGRREYADGAPVDVREVLEAEARMAESAAKIVVGDMKPLYALLPTRRWTPEMHDVFCRSLDSAATTIRESLDAAHATTPTTEGDPSGL